jgi:NAD dependent epimerase/dehydratase family enzyme
MRRNPRLWRNLICALVAAAVAIAAQPGVMAMPAPQPMTMAGPGHAMPACGQMNHQKERGAPCKGVSFCFGMLSCYGMAALTVAQVVPANAAEHGLAAHFNESISGLTHPPENPPPIA